MNKTRLISIFCGTAITFLLLYMIMQETVWKFQSKSNFVWWSKIYIFCQVQKKIAHICESFSEDPKIHLRFFMNVSATTTYHVKLGAKNLVKTTISQFKMEKQLSIGQIWQKIIFFS